MEFVSIEEDPRYVQGKVFLKEKNFEDAIELFSSLLQSGYALLIVISLLANNCNNLF